MKLTTCLVLALPAVAHAAPPAGLACLAEHYAVTPIEKDGAWYGAFADGRTVPWDDGKDKTLDEALAHPDLEDTLARPYVPGPIRAVTDPNDDPGRIRVDALFVATYPKARIVQTRFMGKKMRVHARVAPAFERVSARLTALRKASPELAPWLATFSGTFVERNIAGTDRPSSHSYGVSIDLDAKKTSYWRWSEPSDRPRPKGAKEGTDHPMRWHNAVPQAIVDAFEAEGFIWGGRWYHYDTMHFEYRPELLECSGRR